MTPRTLALTDTERADLEHTRDRDSRPYLRERAAALLKVADDMPAATVAKIGLHKPRHPETILIWLNDYEQTRTLSPQPARRTRLSHPKPGAGSHVAPAAPVAAGVRGRA